MPGVVAIYSRTIFVSSDRLLLSVYVRSLATSLEPRLLFLNAEAVVIGVHRGVQHPVRARREPATADDHSVSCAGSSKASNSKPEMDGLISDSVYFTFTFPADLYILP